MKDTHYCKILMQTNKLPYAEAGSEIYSRGHQNVHWQINQIHNIYLPDSLDNALLIKLFFIIKHCKRA